MPHGIVGLVEGTDLHLATMCPMRYAVPLTGVMPSAHWKLRLVIGLLVSRTCAMSAALLFGQELDVGGRGQRALIGTRRAAPRTLHCTTASTLASVVVSFLAFAMVM